ncbi:redoxin domain-containing protein [Gimesia algae]|uniref:Thiol-disulfide oxidoreductase n=2 Tax=Gimesia algae TaxID=2527971 RepID=A0A517VJJ9_9PLAN|nr:redoxin domain-containing protein [Gimesia algae]QDT93184.1 thiol-disulfide oxidoreductase [Gimesia algae]
MEENQIGGNVMVCFRDSESGNYRFSWWVWTLLTLFGAFQLSLWQAPLMAAEPEELSASRPPQVETLYEPGQLGGHGATLHRVTITGTARNTAGDPVKDADIYVSSRGWIIPSDFEQLRGHTRSDEYGHFVLKDVQLFVINNRDSRSRPDEGDFIVFGTKENYGLTWHPTRTYRPAARPEETDSRDRNSQSTTSAFYQNEPIVIDLQFDTPAKLKGVITDKQGHPLANAKVQLGYVDRPLSTTPHRTGSCEYLKQKNPYSNQNDSFINFSVVPLSMRETYTDAQGRYEFTQLRRDTSYSANIDPGPEFDPWQFTLVTASQSRNSRNTVAAGYAGEVNHQFTAPRDVTVRVVQSDSGRPVSNVLVTAHPIGEVRRSGIQARTDSQGKARLRLIPDEYKLVSEPNPDQPFLYLSQQYFVPKREASGRNDTPNVTMKLNPAAIVKLKAINAKTGAPIPGVRFNYETYDSGEQTPVSTQTVYVDYPFTNDAGEIQAFMEPGTRRFVVAEPFSLSQAAGSRSERIKLTAGQVTEVTIKLTPAEFLPTHLVASEIQPRKNSLYVPEIQKKWHIQSELLRLTPLRITTQKVSIYRKSVDTENLLKDLRALDPYELPDIKSLLNKYYTGELDWYKQVLTAQGTLKHEARYFNPDARPPLFFNLSGQPLPNLTTMTDGWKTIHHQSMSNQAGINLNRRGRINFHVASPYDFCEWPSLRNRIPAPKNTKKPDVNISQAGQRIIYERESDERVFRRVLDQDTGFIFETSYQIHSHQSEQVKLSFAPYKLANGLILPGMHINWKTYQGKLQRLEVTLIEQAEILSTVPADAFAIALPAGTEFIDSRQLPDNISYIAGNHESKKILSGPVSDFAAYLQRNPYYSHEMETEPQLGRHAPTLEPALWLTADGKTAAPNLNGKVALIHFWGTRNANSMDQLSEMKAAYKKYAEQPVVLIGLHDSYTSTSQLQAIAEQKDLKYTLAIDQRPEEAGWFGKTMQHFRVRDLPQMAVIDQHGNLTFVGDLRQALQKVNQLLDEKN